MASAWSVLWVKSLDLLQHHLRGPGAVLRAQLVLDHAETAPVNASPRCLRHGKADPGYLEPGERVQHEPAQPVGWIPLDQGHVHGTADVGHERPVGIVVEGTGLPVAHPGDARGVTPVLQGVHQLQQGILALVAHHEVAVVQAVLRGDGCMAAAEDHPGCRLRPDPVSHGVAPVGAEGHQGKADVVAGEDVVPVHPAAGVFAVVPGLVAGVLEGLRDGKAAVPGHVGLVGGYLYRDVVLNGSDQSNPCSSSFRHAFSPGKVQAHDTSGVNDRQAFAPPQGIRDA
jgi:hypothetical protein